MLKQINLTLCCIGAYCSLAEAYTGDWTGFYAGSKMGAALEQYAMNTVVSPNPFINAAQAQVINNAGYQSLNSNGFLTGIEGGYNWQRQNFLLGFEGDIQALSNSSIINSNALPYPDGSGNQFVVSSYASNNWLLTLRPRLGWVSPYGLLYATGGLGLTYLQSDFLLSSDLPGFESQQVSTAIAGYVVGGGIETSLTKQLSLKAEYLYENFGSTQAHLMNQAVPTGSSITNSVDLDGSLIMVGLNYHMQDRLPTWLHDTNLWRTSNWEANLGARVFISSGTVGAPQPLLNTSDIGDILASRLVFSQLTGISEEAYARFDHESGMFVKGYLGAGTIINGQLNDEDFPAENAYSNTFSNADGNLSYGVIDLGYSFLKTAAANTGLLIGYNYNAQTLKIYNCRQLAGDNVCAANSAVLNDYLVLSENDSFNSLRLGLVSQYQITPKLSLSSEVAYLPVVSFTGLYRHNARQLLGPEQSNTGDGTMLEAVLGYQINDTWNIGVGGRYWAWNMHNGSLIFDFLGDPEVFSEPARFNTTRYGGFLQINYHHPDSTMMSEYQEPMDWQGIFIGGNVGSAWGNSNWSDPFSWTEAEPGFINVAGFGDHITSSGPVGGGNVMINWQTKDWVYGLTGSISAADIRGDNTLFSGLGGINGQSKINYLGTLGGRVGRAFNRSLIYINGGASVLNTQFTLTGNTGALILGNETQTVTTWGGSIGAGLEYAFDENWASSVEYDYLDLPKTNVAFPNVQLINEQNISVNQSLNMVKLAVNCKI